MTLQQLEYLVALARERHFVRAAESCGVTQPTLSAMIQKLEDELGASLFDRSKYPVEATETGRQVIAQAQVVLTNMAQLGEIIAQKKHTLEGEVNLAVIPTIAPYLLPGFLSHFRNDFPQVSLQVHEMQTSSILDQLREAWLDIGILATPLSETNDFLTIPLYYERFLAYISPTEKIYKKAKLSASDMPLENIWVLREGHCLRDQIFNFCGEENPQKRVFESGSIDTLIRIVDHNGGYTVIPELHIPLMTEEKREHIRPIDDPPAVREISLIIRRDFIRERILNAVADTVKKVVPVKMIGARLQKFAIRI